MRKKFMMIQVVYYEDGTFKHPFVGWDFDREFFTFTTKDKAMCFPLDNGMKIISDILDSFSITQSIVTLDITYI